MEAARQSQQRESSAVRRLRQQLERSGHRQAELEQLVRQLSAELRQLPQTGGEAAAAERRVRHAEQQLLTLARQRLRVQTEIARLRSRARLLHSQQSVHESQQVEREAAAAAAAAAGQSDHFHPLHHQHQQGRRSSGGSTPDTEESHTVRELTEQLERARAKIGEMRASAHQYDGASNLPALFYPNSTSSFFHLTVGLLFTSLFLSCFILLHHVSNIDFMLLLLRCFEMHTLALFRPR